MHRAVKWIPGRTGRLARKAFLAWRRFEFNPQPLIRPPQGHRATCQLPRELWRMPISNTSPFVQLNPIHKMARLSIIVGGTFFSS